MDSFYSDDELKKIGFRKLGENVKLSKKASIYAPEKISIGSNVRIDDFCILSGLITIGNYNHIAAYTALYGGDCGITIGNFVNLSSRICIYSVSDDYSGHFMTGPMVQDFYRNVQEKPVFIGNHVIVGSTSMIMPGVIIGDGCAFGAFSFVNHSVDPWTINVGIPCKTTKKREKDILEMEQEMLKSINEI